MNFSYIGAERIWIARVDGVEWIVSGDDDGPDPIRQALIERAFAERATVEAIGREHLEKNAARPGGAAWLLEAVESGRVESDAPSQMRLCFTNATDDYGWWEVVLSATDANYYPAQFSRRQR